MKNLIRITFAIVFSSLILSCEEDNINNTATVISGPRIVSPATAITLAEDQDDNPAFTLVWDHSDFDVSTEVNYIVEVALSGTGFATPITAAQTTDRFFTWTVKELNQDALEAGLLGNEQGFLDIRVKSNLGSDGFGEEISESLTLTVTPYENIVIPEPEFVNLFLVGNGTDSNKDGEANDSDWTNDGINSYLVRNPDNKNLFTYTGNFGAAFFKLLVNKTQWAPQYGGEGGSLLYRQTEADPDPAAIEVGAAGYYTLNVDLETLSYTLEAFDASTADVYDGIELMGDATNSDDADNDGTPDGWQTGLQFERSDFDPHVWYKNDVVLGEGQAKFRANMNWDFSWGGDSFPSAIESSANNIPTIPGTYDIWFNDLTKSYIFVVK